MKTHLYRITCLTNLHVGNGEGNYSVIGNEVERDPVLDNVPIINGSGVKGALREHCVSSGLSDCDIEYIFGADKGSNGTTQGNFKFLSANLLARPLRVSNGLMSYVLTTTPGIIDNFKTLAEGLKYEGLGSPSEIQVPSLREEGNKKKIVVSKNKATESAISIENEPAGTFDLNRYSYLEKLIWSKTGRGADVLGIAQDEFAADCSLPVLARNKLENGISKNLWYEEIVPHKSVFYLFILAPESNLTPESNEDDKEKVAFDKGIKARFNACITGTGTYVQFGGNATVGEGYCKVEEVVADEKVATDE